MENATQRLVDVDIGPGDSIAVELKKEGMKAGELSLAGQYMEYYSRMPNLYWRWKKPTFLFFFLWRETEIKIKITQKNWKKFFK